MELWLSVPPGLEFVVAEEAEELLGRPVRIEEGGVSAQGDLTDAAGLCLWSRTASRVRVVAGRVASASLQQLQQEVRKLDWSPFAVPGQPVEVKASVSNATRIRRADAAAHKAQMGIQDALRGARRGRAPKTPLQVTLRVDRKEALLSVDAGGLLHRRGYRKATAKAPIRENLGMAILRAAGWQPGVPLIDPMCGAGTFSIEAALASMDKAPGLEREPPVVTTWPGYDRKTWPRMLQEAKDAVGPQQGVFRTADRNQGAVQSARSNAKRAGVLLDVLQKDVTEPFEATAGPGLVVLNPPYGVRVADNVKLAGLYAKTGRALQEQFPGWRLAVVCPDKALAGRLVKGIEEITRFRNGGISVGVWVGTL